MSEGERTPSAVADEMSRNKAAALLTTDERFGAFSAELGHAGFEITSDVACVVHQLLCPGLGLLAKDVG